MKLVANMNSYIFHGKFKELSRFSIIGVLNTLIDFITFTIFNSLFGVNYVISQLAGYSLGVVNSFVFNKKWTFKENNANKKISKELFQFIVVNITSLSVSIICMKFLVKDFNVNIFISKIIVTLIAQVTNFAAYKFWVFTKKE